MICVHETLSQLKNIVNNESINHDKRYMAALVIGSGFQGFQNVLKPEPVSNHSINILGGKLHLSYNQEEFHARFVKRNSVTTYKAVCSVKELGLYTCECCINESYQIIAKSVIMIDDAFPELKCIKILKRRIVLQFSQFSVTLMKHRPLKTIQHRNKQNFNTVYQEI